VPRVKLSHPDKVLFPGDGITKADLADYYDAVAPAMLPHVRRRPLNLWRWNAGIERERVVQQEIPKGAPDWVARVEVSRRRGGAVTHAMADDADTLRWLAQVNCVTPHVWTSRADRLDRPDRMIFDLDPPDEGADFDHIREGALAMGELLRELGREPYAMTSGSRGIHVVAPLRRTAVHDVVRRRAGEIAEELAARHPDRLTTAWRKNKREGRILIDTARNTYAQTTVAPYSVRAKPGAPVATPLRWEELEDARLRADAFTLATLPARLERDGDPWAALGRS
jgi:bifunctional non-homologous end joining protein LigD